MKRTDHIEKHEKKCENNRILFITKQRRLYGSTTKLTSSGLFNSAKFVVDMLNQNGYNVKLADVVDGNSIDREIHQFKPAVVVIEAYWATPEKFKEVMKLHPKVKWIVRNHSKPDFLSQEGIAYKWSLEYMRLGMVIACNSEEATKAFRHICIAHNIPLDRVIYLPNYYPLVENDTFKTFEGNTLKVGCFGAIRPLKNQFNQAIAAIEVANKFNLNLEFHMNEERIEMGASPIYKSLIAIFEGSQKCKLVFHNWLNHDQFLNLMSEMDVSMQVSLSETFNIISADAVNENIPAMVSDEVPWLRVWNTPNPHKPEEIAEVLENIIYCPKKKMEKMLVAQRHQLTQYNDFSHKLWTNTLHNMFFI